MKYVVIVPLANANPVLPPFESQDGYQMQYPRGDGVHVNGGLEGGFDPIPGPVPTAMVVIDTTPAMLTEMESRDACIFVEEVADATPTP